MGNKLEKFAHGMMSGENRSAGARAAWIVTSIAEPVYASLMRARNGLYERGMLRAHDLGRPTISIGNLTTGGTGKTPLVLWLAENLRERGKHPAILLRGYRKKSGDVSDEAQMLQSLLSGEKTAPVGVGADRVESAGRVLADRPETDVFLLDDGFQHRRAARDFDLVLISAMRPFGYGHILPRGLLREPMSGLRRADAIVVTHASETDAMSLTRIESQVRRMAGDAPIYRASHIHIGLRIGEETAVKPLEKLSGLSYFALAGIGDTASLEKELAHLPGRCVGSQWFADHHHYTAEDVKKLDEAARSAGAEVILTTEKDWAKLSLLSEQSELPVWRLELAIQFEAGHGEALIAQILPSLSQSGAKRNSSR